MSCHKGACTLSSINAYVNIFKKERIILVFLLTNMVPPSTRRLTLIFSQQMRCCFTELVSEETLEVCFTKELVQIFNIKTDLTIILMADTK